LLAASAERHAAQRLQGCQQRQQQAVGALRGLADDYHPFDPQTGQPLTAQQVEQRLGQRLETLREVAQEAQLGERAAEAVGKAGGWLAALVASLAWFWGLTRRRLEELSLSEQAEKAFEEKLLAGLYWQQAAGRARTAQERQRKKELAEGLLKEAWSEGGALSALTEQERQEVARAAREIAGLFQRSSSCVEGRNGRLALFHHGHSGLSEGRLKALTAVHNYVVKRADGSTAAERFFGVKQRDAFSWLLARLPELPRPAAKRPKRPPQPATLAG